MTERRRKATDGREAGGEVVVALTVEMEVVVTVVVVAVVRGGSIVTSY